MHRMYLWQARQWRMPRSPVSGQSCIAHHGRSRQDEPDGTRPDDKPKSGSVIDGLEMPETERNSTLSSSLGPSEDGVGGDGGGVGLFAEDDDEELGVGALADEEALVVIIEGKRAAEV